MIKEQVIAILQAKKDEQMAAVAALFDGMISQVQALSEDQSELILQLQAQVAELQAKLHEVDIKAKEIDALIPDA